MKKNLFISGTLAVLMIAMVISSGCHHADKKSESPDTAVVNDTAGQKTDAADKATTTDLSAPATLYTVRMTQQNFIDVFGHQDVNIRQVYFRFRNKSGQWTLTAYGADETGNAATSEYDLDIVQGATTLQFIPKDNDYEQQVKRGHFKNYLGLSTNSDVTIPDNKFAEVWLTPCTMTDANGETLIYYKITPPRSSNASCGTGRPTYQAGLIATNPSPPAKPCADDGSCDNSMKVTSWTKKQIYEAVQKNKTN